MPNHSPRASGSITRRSALHSLAAASASLLIPTTPATHLTQSHGERPAPPPSGITLLNPRTRTPLSLIIDDSTALANLAHFAIPQFAEVFPGEYLQDWRALPREIPDSFVRTFAHWCQEHGVKGKYSMVPYPACVGWLDRELPGWTKRQLEASLELVRRELLPAWDIHPEMVSHTWAVDTRTGRPLAERSQDAMENWGFSQNKSADELAEYLAYALNILREVGLPCAGITTPGGFGNRNLVNLAAATDESVRDVFAAEIPHYFRHLYTDERSVAPRIERARGLSSDDPRCVVSIIGCTGDWFGGWDGLEPGHADQFITADGQGGRLPQVIARGEPAILVGHWPGFYCNGNLHGFRVFQDVVQRLETHYPGSIWMNLSEIARYWTARELTRIQVDRDPNGRALSVRFKAPFSCHAFTLKVENASPGVILDTAGKNRVPLQSAPSTTALDSGQFTQTGDKLTLCFNLPRGVSALEFAKP